MSANTTGTSGWWLGWYNAEPLDTFELHSPWWVSGERCSDDAETMVAAVRAADESAAWEAIRLAYDSPPDEIEQRFIERMEPDQSPFTDRFPQASWMAWTADRTCHCPSHFDETRTPDDAAKEVSHADPSS